MSNPEDRIPLHRGSVYTILRPTRPFETGEQLVYVGDYPSYVDGNFSCHELTFFDQETGRTKSLSIPSLDNLEPLCERHFKLLGGWQRPAPGSVKPIDPLSYGPSNEILKNLVPYLKDLVEGKPGIENWYVWIARHERLLEVAMSPSQFLHFRYAPYDNACELLEELDEPFKPGVRYQWLRL